MGQGGVQPWGSRQFMAGQGMLFVGSVSCSKVPQQCSEGVLAALGLEPRTLRSPAQFPTDRTTAAHT